MRWLRLYRFPVFLSQLIRSIGKVDETEYEYQGQTDQTVRGLLGRQKAKQYK